MSLHMAYLDFWFLFSFIFLPANILTVFTVYFVSSVIVFPTFHPLPDLRITWNVHPTPRKKLEKKIWIS